MGVNMNKFFWFFRAIVSLEVLVISTIAVAGVGSFVYLSESKTTTPISVSPATYL
jgi:hypothetical protein